MSHGKSTSRLPFSHSLTNSVVIKYCDEHDKAYVDRGGLVSPHISTSNTSAGKPDDGLPECHHCHAHPSPPSLSPQNQGPEGKNVLCFPCARCG